MPHSQEWVLELQDDQWTLPKLHHDRQPHDRHIVRAIVWDGCNGFYFMSLQRQDAFGPAELIETSGGGVKPSEDLEKALVRELQEEIGAKVKILTKIGVVSDYYNLIHRHNVNHFYLVQALSFGQKNMEPYEINDFHMRTVKLTYTQAVTQYLVNAQTRLGTLVTRRELPVLLQAKAWIDTH